MIRLDGSYGEGGGQIIRTALAFSAVTSIPFEVGNIRKGRCDNGLKAQHLFCVKAAQQLCDADVEGAEIGSTTLKFIPKKLAAKDLNINIGTAGSTTLLMQSVLLPAFFVNKRINMEISGGTDTKWSMPVDYFSHVLVPQVSKFAFDAKVDVVRRGYFPKGGGKVRIRIDPKYKLSEFNSFDDFKKRLVKDKEEINLVERGKLLQIKGISHASNDLKKANVAERQRESALKKLSEFNVQKDISVEYSETLSTGSGIVLWAEFEGINEDSEKQAVGADALGAPGKKSEVVGMEAAQKLAEEIKLDAPVDEHLADNLVPWLGLFGRQMKTTRMSRHTTTNIYVVEQFLGRVFEVDRKNNVVRRI